MTSWDEKYFARLKDFAAQASQRSIIIEANLVSSYYGDKSWFRHPFYFKNTINNVGNCQGDEAETLKIVDVTAAQARQEKQRQTQAHGDERLHERALCAHTGATPARIATGVQAVLCLRSLRASGAWEA